MAGGLGNIGSASISVEADFARFHQQLRDEGRAEIELNVTADTTSAQREIDGLDPDAVSVEVNADTKPFERQVKKASKDSGDDSATEFSKAFGRRIAALDIGGTIAKLIKPAASIAAIGVIAQAASAAGAGVIALTASLSQLSGALVAIPSTLLAGAQAMGVFKLATSGVGEALGGLNDKIDPDKLKELTPPAQEFVRVLDALKPRIRDFQTSLQGNLFPGLTSAIKTLTPALQTLEGPLAGTATALGDVANNAARAVADMIGPIGQLTEFNNQLIGVLGQVGIELGRSLITVLVAARPLLLFMSTAVLQFATALSGDLASATGQSGLADFFARTRESLTRFVTLLRSLGGIFASIFGAALPFGNQLLDMLNMNAAGLDKFLNTTEGRDTLTKFFASVMPAIVEVGRLVRDLGKDFLTLAATPGLAGFIATFRTQLLPVLVDLVSVTTKEFLPVLIPALTEVGKLLIKFSGSSGALITITKAIGGMAKALNAFFEDHKSSLKIANDLLVWFAAIAALGLGSAISALAGFGKGVKFLWSVGKLVVNVFRFFFAFLRGGLPALTKLGGNFAKIAGWLGKLGPAFSMVGQAFAKIGPALARFGAVFSRIGAVIRTVIVPFTALRSAVVIVAEVVVGAVVAIAAGLSLPVTVVVAAIAAIIAVIVLAIKYPQKLLGVFKVAFDGIKVLILLGKVQIALWVAAIRIGFNAVKAAVRLLWNGFKVALSGIGAALRVLLAGVRLWWSGVTNFFRLVRAAISAWWNGVKSILSAAREAFVGLVNRIKSILSGLNLFQVGKDIIGTLLSGLKSGFEKVKDFIRSIAGTIKKLKGPIAVDRKLLIPEGKAIMGGFNKGLHQRWAGIRDWIGNIGGFFKGIVGGASIKDQVVSILLGDGKIGDLNNKLSSLLGLPAGLFSGALGGFFHPSSGAADTLAQANLMGKLFHAGITSFMGGKHAPNSLHYAGLAADFGDSRATHANLTSMAAFAGKLQSIFQEVFWQNKLWNGGPHGYIADHMDHVHLGWQHRAAGGNVRAGQAYQWNERGREMFVPQQNGYVMNAGRTKELIGAIRSLSSQKQGPSNSRNAQIHVHAAAADPNAVGSAIMSRLGSVFSLA